jgi:multisubunit Na+/H+ antiporter MnhB subunit
MRHLNRSDNTIKKYTNSEIKARLILMVGLALSLTFIMSIGMILYSLAFVVQPLEVSPNDSKSWETLSSVLLVLAGALTGLLASNGLKDKDKSDD